MKAVDEVRFLQRSIDTLHWVTTSNTSNTLTTLRTQMERVIHVHQQTDVKCRLLQLLYI